jgi:type III secretory pathway component EscS
MAKEIQDELLVFGISLVEVAIILAVRIPIASRYNSDDQR